MDLFEAFKKMLNGGFTAGEPTVTPGPIPVADNPYGGFGPPRQEEFIDIPPLGMSGEDAFTAPQAFDIENLLRAAQELENENAAGYNPFEAAYNLASAGDNEGGMSLLRNTGQQASLGNEDWLDNPRVRAMFEALGSKLPASNQGDLMAGAQQAMNSRNGVR